MRSNRCYLLFQMSRRSVQEDRAQEIACFQHVFGATNTPALFLMSKFNPDDN